MESFPYDWELTSVVCYQQVVLRLQLKDISTKFEPWTIWYFILDDNFSGLRLQKEYTI